MYHEDYENDLERMTKLEARYEKQLLCLAHNKRCIDCDGNDEYGNTCKYKLRGGVSNDRVS
jgi:hypothetical protein